MTDKPFSLLSSPSNPWMYDVFLSFRGRDTRKSFTDHLYYALTDAGIKTFRDCEQLRRGEDISSELLKAIKGSRISIIVFSKNFASSIWCLEELVQIMECRRSVGHTVWPVFYDIDPSDVRHQQGSFEDAFARHEDDFVLKMDKVGRWRAALTEAANLSGSNLKEIADGYEGKFIKKIVGEIQEILKELNQTSRATNPVGIDLGVQEPISSSNLGSNDVRMLGICGIGGICKTKFAKAIYNKLSTLNVRTAFTSRKDFGREAREAQWALAQRTLHGLQLPETPTLFNERTSLSDLAEKAKRRAEIARFRELHKLRGQIQSFATLRGLDFDKI